MPTKRNRPPSHTAQAKTAQAETEVKPWYVDKIDRRSVDRLQDRLSDIPLLLPPGWRGPAYAWDLAFHLVRGLNALPLLRQLSQPTDPQSPVGSLWDLLTAIRQIVDTLIVHGDGVALLAFQEVFSGPNSRAALVSLRPLPLVLQTFEDGSCHVLTWPVSLILCLWTALTDPRVTLRIRCCLSCHVYFLDFTKNRSQKRCSQRCTRRFWNRPSPRKR